MAKNTVISFRVSDAEKERIEAKASAKKLRINTYARELVTGFDPDVVAARSRAAVTDQEKALEALSNSVKTLRKDVDQVGKRFKSDLSMVLAIATLAGMVFLIVGACVGYGAALLTG